MPFLNCAVDSFVFKVSPFSNCAIKNVPFPGERGAC